MPWRTLLMLLDFSAVAASLLLAAAGDAGVAAGMTTGSAAERQPRSFGRSAHDNMYELTAHRKRVSLFTAPTSGRADALSAYLDGRGSGDGRRQSVRFVIYADGNALPSRRLGETAAGTIRRGDRGSWMRLRLARALPLRAKTAYYLGIHSADDNFVGRYGNVLGIRGGMTQNDDGAFDGAADRFGGATTTVDVGLSIRAHYVTTQAVKPNHPQMRPNHTARPRIVGNPIVGGLLTAVPGNWRGHPAPTFTYGWQRCSRLGSNCRSIARATIRTYRVAPADTGKAVRVVVTASNAVRSARATSGHVRIRRRASAVPSPSRPRVNGRANLWVVATAGGDCRRSNTLVTYDPAHACASVAAAYASANRTRVGSRILVKGGDYPRLQISGKRASTDRIIFEAAPGERPIFSGAMSIGAPDSPAVSPSYLTLRNLETAERGHGETPENRHAVKVERGSHHIRLENLRAGGFLIHAARHVLVIGGSYGPCRASKVDPVICDGNKVDGWVDTRAKDIVVERVVMHGFDYARSCALAGDCHYRSMYVNGVKGFTLRNSTIRDSVFAPWLTISGPDAAQWGNENILIENNFFGSQVFFDQKTGARSYAKAGLAFQLAWCENAAPGVVGYRNVTVRFNSVSRSGQLEMASLAQPNCRFENVRVYGNIAGARSTCVSGVMSRYNVFAGVAGRRVCGSTDVNIGGTALPFYARDAHAPRGTDFRLAGPRSAPDGRVPVSAGCPTTDRFGVRRGLHGFCDAGAAER